MLTLLVWKVAGVEEANPVMQILLSAGVLPFLSVKLLAVFAAVRFLDAHLVGRGRNALSVIVAVFWLVIGWHFFGLIQLSHIL
tara:strand:+ start:328 stop:576 length:249 start_codon:yes stop_codon:yes gene_type:complete